MMAPPQIAIIDDDRSIRDAMSSLVRSAGYRSVEFESATEFLEHDHKEEIACLMLDMHMPGLSGLELQQRLAEMKHPIPAIFVTVHHADVREMALQQGAVAVLGKPCSDEDLLKAIQACLRSSRHDEHNG